MDRSVARLALWALVHVSLAALAFTLDRWFVWVVVWAIQAFWMLTLVATVHECVHRHFVAPRWGNELLGRFAAGFGFVNFEAYRAQHMTHHANACGEGDAEGEPYAFTARWQIVAAFVGGGFLYALSVFATGVMTAFGYTPMWLRSERQRQRIRVNVLVLALVYGAIALAVVADLVSLRGVAFAWLIPASIGLLGPLPFVLIPEHYDAPGPGSPFENTRTCVSNPALRFVYLNTNLHTAHHHRASVPWHGLVDHHRTIEDRIEEEWLFPSYTAFHRFMWRTVGRTPAHQAVSA